MQLIQEDSEGKKQEILLANLQEPAFGVASGQALVLYEDDKVLGGGFIV